MLSDKIEVFLMSNEFGKNESLGLARIRGIDEASGLAVLELDHPKPYENVMIEELKATNFMPEYRLDDPNTKNHLTALFEYSVEKGSKTNQPSLRPVTADLSQYSAYHDATLDMPTMAKLATVKEGQSAVGSPIFNQLGECVGIKHEVGFDQARRTVIIPSAVCTRIAAKLMADGVVHRASLPIVVSGMLTGVKEPRMGLNVKSTTSQEPIYQGLKGTTIVGIDNVATPSLTEWLQFLERAYAMGTKTVVVEVFEGNSGLTSCATLPLGQ
jgi:hypothetical protein